MDASIRHSDIGYDKRLSFNSDGIATQLQAEQLLHSVLADLGGCQDGFLSIRTSARVVIRTRQNGDVHKSFLPVTAGKQQSRPQQKAAAFDATQPRCVPACSNARGDSKP